MTNVDMILEWYERLWRNGDETVIDQLMDAQCRSHGLGPDPIAGRDQFRAFYRAFRARFPEIRIVVKETVESGDLLALVARATLRDAAGNEHVLRGSLMARVRNGQFVEAWDNWDFLGLLVQMGAVSPTAMAEAMSPTETH